MKKKKKTFSKWDLADQIVQVTREKVPSKLAFSSACVRVFLAKIEEPRENTWTQLLSYLLTFVYKRRDDEVN